MSDLPADNSGGVATDNSSTSGPVDTASETGATNGQAQGGAPADDLFRGVDPNRLPPDVKPHYDSMLRDYREKTSKLAETIKAESAKATEAYRSKAEFYDQIAQQQEFVKQWNDYVQKAQASGQPAQEGDPVLSQMKAQIQEMNQKIQLSELTQLTDAFAEAVDDKGQKLHSDFDKLNGYSVGQLKTAQGAEDFSLLRGCVELAPGNTPQEKLANGYKTAKAVFSSIFEEGRKAGMGRLQTKVMNGSNPPSNSAGDLLQVTEKKPRNAHEALALAKRGIVVSRE